ncbi:LytTR family DNA-binding domain-containing protein [Pedobacter frigoris]|uniref:LytR/AlgR family response regulator transcription factor n=1 Tax=Pedobacter frigoris TaxID=2571272 RepID=UPI00292D01D4|nr:LytTR family DNA-binding domain-containing protein [Pedobacter frigoris]
MMYKRKYLLIHFCYWLLITGFFIYEKKYLIYKASMPYFVACVSVRILLLIMIAYLNLHYFLPRFLMKKRYFIYAFAVLLSVTGYLLAQSLFDFYLYGYVVGPLRNSRLMEALSYNFFSTLWYLGLMLAVKLSMDWYEQQGIIKEYRTLKVQANNVEHVPVGEDFIFVKSGVQRIKLQFSEVTHIQGLKDYAIIYTQSEKIILKGSIKAMLDIFPHNRFIRVHKSFIVSVEKIVCLERNRIVLNDHQIPIGRNFKADLERAVVTK